MYMNDGNIDLIDPAATRRSMATEMVRDVPSLLFGIYAEKFTSVSLICKVFYGKMKTQ